MDIVNLKSTINGQFSINSEQTMSINYQLKPGSTEQRQEMNQLIPQHYQAKSHFMIINGVCLSAIFLLIALIENLSWTQTILFPLILVLLNLGEYLLHKGPLHHKTPGAKLIFHRHTIQHHRYFTEDTMDIASEREAYFIFFPQWASILLLAGASILGYILSLVFSKNIGLIFVLALMLHYLSYEWMHLLCHIQNRAPFNRSKLVRLMASHHTQHHNLSLMSHKNFNFAVPIFDYLFKTKT